MRGHSRLGTGLARRAAAAGRQFGSLQSIHPAGIQATLALLKPDLLADAQQVAQVEAEIRTQFRVALRTEVHWTPHQASQFYAEHHGKVFFGRLISYMTSGPLVAMALTGPNAILAWREMMGKTRPPQMRVAQPHTMRARFGLTDTRNSFHGSDSVSSATRELEFLFGVKAYERCVQPRSFEEAG